MSPIQQVAVIGLGTMGHGIAQTFAMAGCEVTGFDDVQAASDSLHDRVRQNLRDFVGVELLPADQVDDVLVVEIYPDCGPVRFRLLRLFLDRENPHFVIELDDTVTFGVVDPVAENRRAARALVGATQYVG